MSRTASETVKPKRVSITGQRDVLNVTGYEFDFNNFHYCWVNDFINTGNTDNIQKYVAAGYEFCIRTPSTSVGEAKVDKPSSMTDNRITMPVGNGRTGYLMRVPLEYYNEDVESYNDRVDQNEKEWRDRLVNEGNAAGLYGKISVQKT